MIGTGQILAGGYLGYKSLEYGLPRALGIRIEYHTTSKENAELIKRAGNTLDPKFGGKNGFSKMVMNNEFINNSEKFIHITGMHADTPIAKKHPVYAQFYGFIRRFTQNIMYKNTENRDLNKFRQYKKELETLAKYDSKKATRKYIFNKISETFFGIFKKSNTKRFCIPGIDSYFNREFISDCDDVALKSSKPIKVYSNRFSAMFAGLRKFGLKGIKENKSRAAFGTAILALGISSAFYLISKGFR